MPLEDEPSLERALRDLLLSDPKIAGILEGRVWPLTRPQNAVLPGIVYQRIGGPGWPVNHDRTGSVREQRHQWNCWASNYDAAVTLGDLVANALNGAGAAGPGIVIPLVWVDSCRDGIAPQRGDQYRQIDTICQWYPAST